MKLNISKAQKEVWEWKDKLYEELKNIPESERIVYLQKKAKEAVEKLYPGLKPFRGYKKSNHDNKNHHTN